MLIGRGDNFAAMSSAREAFVFKLVFFVQYTVREEALKKEAVWGNCLFSPVRDPSRNDLALSDALNQEVWGRAASATCEGSCRAIVRHGGRRHKVVASLAALLLKNLVSTSPHLSANDVRITRYHGTVNVFAAPCPLFPSR